MRKIGDRIRLGELFMPYKPSTDRLTPFAGQLGSYDVVMGNTGGDNRIEFGTRMDHVIDYSSPNWSGVSFDAAYAFGQQVDPNSNLVPLGSVDCTGGNVPGSGNLPINCDDGGFDDAYSVDLKFESHGLYLVAAYEMHKRVNRSSDGDGSNNPLYDYWYSEGATGPDAKYLDWADFTAYAAEYGSSVATAVRLEFAHAYDIADEWAMKFGGQYSFDFGLTISYLYEDMHRSLPQVLQFQNERQRTGDWLALEQDFDGGADRIAIGWAHASASVGDPGGQHNFNPNGIGGNQANMYTIAWWHKLDKQLTVYFDAAETINDGNAHYDIGAGGHGVKTDCHDATHAQFIDYSSAGPTTWGGCHPLGVSTGVNYRFVGARTHFYGRATVFANHKTNSTACGSCRRDPDPGSLCHGAAQVGCPEAGGRRRGRSGHPGVVGRSGALQPPHYRSGGRRSRTPDGVCLGPARPRRGGAHCRSRPGCHAGGELVGVCNATGMDNSPVSR